MKKRFLLPILILLITIAISIIFIFLIQPIYGTNDTGYIVGLSGNIISALLSGVITFLCIFISIEYARSVEDKNRVFEKRPFIIVKIKEEIEHDTSIQRFPWGGDPPPRDVVDIWLQNKVKVENCTREQFPFWSYCNSNRTYLLVSIKNIGYGFAMNVSFDQIKEDDLSDENRIINDVIEAQAESDIKLYLIIDIYNSTEIEEGDYKGAKINAEEEGEFKFICTFEDIFKNKYRQEITLYYLCYDNNLNDLAWNSKEPTRIR